jgi:hypothetical protein
MSATLGGTAATGAPIIGGTVNVTCAGGSALSAITAANGSWQVTMTGQTLPCAVQVSGGNLTSGQTYHAVALQLGTVNISPLTDLTVANLTGMTPSAWFGGLNASAFQAVTSSAVNNALNKVSAALGVSSMLNGLNPMTSTFTAAPGDRIDDILSAMKAAIANAGMTHSMILSSASSVSFAAPNGLSTAIMTAFASTTTGGGTGGGTTTCSGSGTTMIFTSGASGSPYTTGQQVCFTASATSLAFSGKTLTGPAANAQVQTPYSAYTFSDTAAGVQYEVVFNSGALYEINVLNGTGATFYGGFQPPASGSSGTGGSTAGSSTLTVNVTVSGITSVAATVANVPMPTSQAEFCGAIQSDSTFTQIGTGAGGTLTINSCSFSGKVGTISATLTITSPVSMTIPYTVTYTYN